MGAIFAVACTVGQEIYVKNRLEKEFQSKGITSVKRVIANETYIDFINQDTENVDFNSEVSTNDIDNHMKKQGIRNAINNRRIQLEFLARYDSEKVNEYKENARKEINELEKQARELSSCSRKIKSIIDGYVLFELNTDDIHLPVQLQAFISSLSRSYQYLHGLVSECSIMEHELDGFLNSVEEESSGEVEIEFEEEKTHEQIEAEQRTLLTELNDLEQSNVFEKNIIEEKLDNLRTNVVQKVNEFIEKSSVHKYLSKVRAFVQRGKRFVSIPKPLFNNLYSENESAEIRKYLQERDFLKRFEQYTCNRINVIGVR